MIIWNCHWLAGSKAVLTTLPGFMSNRGRSCRPAPIYIMMEDDMAFRIRHLQVFCEAAEVLRGTDYLPGFLRYETLVPHDYAPILENVSPIFLSDRMAKPSS